MTQKNKILSLTALLLVGSTCYTVMRTGSNPATQMGSSTVAQTTATVATATPAIDAATAASKVAFNPANHLRTPVQGMTVKLDLGWVNDLNGPLHNGDRNQTVTLNLMGKSIPMKVSEVSHAQPGVVSATLTTQHPLGLAAVSSVYGKTALTVIDPTLGEVKLLPTAVEGEYRVFTQRKETCATLAPTEAKAQPQPAVPLRSNQTPSTPANDATILADAPNYDPAKLEAGYETIRQIQADTFKQPQGKTRIAVLIVYGNDIKQALPKYGSLDAIRAILETGVTLANGMLSRANANAYFELVGMEQLAVEVQSPSYEPNNAESADLARAVNDAFVENFVVQPDQTRVYRWDWAKLRNKYGADLVTFVSLRDESTPSGLYGVGAAIQKPDGTPYDRFYGGIGLTYFSGLTAGHEWGHALGMLHDKATEAGVDNSGYGVPAYAYGYRIQSTTPRVADVMSYIDYEVRLPVYSNPSFTFQDVALGNSAQADCARVAREQATRVADLNRFNQGKLGDNYLMNVSSRGYIGNGNDVLIAGFVITGNASKRIVLRGVSPGLAKHGLTAVSKVNLTIYNSKSQPIKQVSDWAADATELKATGFAPDHINDAATIMTLSPGAYTMILSSADGTNGVGLVEVFQMDDNMSRFSLRGADDMEWGNLYTRADGNFLRHTLTQGTYGVQKTIQIFEQTPILATTNAGFLGIYRVNASMNPTEAVRTSNDWAAVNPAVKEALLASGAEFIKNKAVYTILAPGTYMVTTDTLANPNQAANRPVESHTIVIHRVSTNTTTWGMADRVVNISTRAKLGNGENVLIAGFIIRGTSPKTVAIRLTGPSLAAHGITNFAVDPRFSLHNEQGIVSTNDNWQTDPEANHLAQWSIGSEMAPKNPTEAAMAVTLNPGAYTVIANAATEGVGLIEVYELR